QSAQGWQTSTVAIPTLATRIGFFFVSSSATNFEGAYIDDVSVYGTRNELNSRLATYDSSQNSTMTRGVDVDAFASARVEYRYWFEPDSDNETLEAAYFVGGNWTYTDLHTGTSAGWRSSAFSIPLGAALIGFRFTSDGFGNAEGAYIDDVKVWGTVRPVTCSAAVDQLVGTEALTGFMYTVSASEGLRPYTWSWAFSDGTTASIQNPLHSFAAAGTFTGTATVTDAAGQTCTAGTPPVTIGHDTTAVSLSPALADLVEGGSLPIYGADGRGHPYDLDWSVEPASCGSIDVARGRLTNFTAAPDAGGSICAVRGSIGLVNAQASLIVLHDTSSIALTPSAATVAEGGTQSLAAVDAFGHALDFQWSTTCGVVAPDAGPGTMFSAVTTGGALCIVTAASGGGSASGPLTIVHDTSTITVSPPSAALREGASQRFTAVDKFSHAFDATWSLAPPSCGSLTALSGPSTSFQASGEAGGTTCTVTAAFGPDRTNATVTVSHDLSSPSLVPLSVTLIEGDEQSFEALDRFGHPVTVGWVLTPSSCGALSVLSGSATSVRTAPDAGDSSCTLTAAGSGVHLGASISVLHGAPAAVRVTLSAPQADEGSTVTVTAEVLDGGNHTLPGLSAEWSATCGAISTATGASKTWSLPNDAGGTSCTATATHGGLSGSATLAVHHGAPYTVVIEPPTTTVGAGGSQVLGARVTDAQGHLVPDMAVAWSASCGVVSPETGPSTTYTAPGDLGGASCGVTAVVADGLSQPTTSTFSSPMSLILPLGAIAPGLGIVLFLLVMRRRRREAPQAL
ncbi:MAG TPA: PKD domain-containing protein, partial [Candidatus Thermoplasmatota archaeon]|nr:PKD domain-containing protein [Candidatus Thermoplasmatota archaeon]